MVKPLWTGNARVVSLSCHLSLGMLAVAKVSIDALCGRGAIGLIMNISLRLDSIHLDCEP